MILVTALIIIAFSSLPTLVTEGNTHFKHMLEWNYFVRVILFTVLNFILYFGNFSQAKDNIIQNNIYCECKETKFFLSKLLLLMSSIHKNALPKEGTFEINFSKCFFKLSSDL